MVWILGIGILIAYSCQVQSLTAHCLNSSASENISLRMDQLSASSYTNPHVPGEALLSENGVGWIASKSDLYQFLKVDLEGNWNVSALVFQGADNNSFTRKLRFTYSLDGFVWHPYKSSSSKEFLGDILEANERYNASTFIKLEPTVNARFLTFNPISYSHRPALALALHGCRLGDKFDPEFTAIVNNIQVNQTWSRNQSPFLIYSQIAIHQSARLTIHPGVAVIFTTSRAGFHVSGTLTSTGTIEHPVLFSGPHPVLRVAKVWDGIYQQSGGSLSFTETVVRQALVGIQGNGESVSVTNSVIHSCQEGIKLSSGRTDNDTAVISQSRLVLNERGIVLHGNKASPNFNIHNTDISENTDNGIAVRSFTWTFDHSSLVTNLVLTNCSLNKNLKNGLNCVSNIPGDINIYNCSFNNNGQKGINFRRSRPRYRSMTFMISHTTFMENGDRGIDLNLWTYHSFTFTIYQNQFFGNIISAVSMYFSPANGNGTLITLKENLFSNHSTGYYYPININQASKYHAIYVIFEDNICEDSNGCLKLIRANNIMDIEISGNTFRNINGTSRSVVSSAIAKLIFTNNTVEKCTARSILEIQNGYGHVIENNAFDSNNDVPCLLKIGTPFKPDEVISAPKNYWGHSYIQAIKQSICDFFLDAAVASVKVQSYFNDSILDNDSFVYVTDEDGFDHNDLSENNSYVVYGGIVRGVRKGNFRADTRIFVNRSLIIEDTGSMEILGNEVLLAENRGIVLRGQLIIGSDNTVSETILRSQESEQRWRGIYVYGGQLVIAKTNITGAAHVITIQTSSVDVHVKHTSVSESDIFLKAEDFNGNMSIIIQSSYLQLDKETIVIVTNDTQSIDIQILDSYLQSNSSGIVSITDQNHRIRKDKPSMRVDLLLEESQFYSNYTKSIVVESCYVHLNFSATRCNFSSKYDNIYTHTLLSNADVRQCEFNDGYRGLHFYFCSKSFGNINVGGDINISNSTFRTEQGIYYNNRYSSDIGHLFKIEDNLFEPKSSRDPKGLFIHRRNSVKSEHVFIVKHNVFCEYSKAVDVDGNVNEISLTQNTFFNNTQVLRLDSKKLEINFVDIEENVIKENNANDGILHFEPYLFINDSLIHVIRNTFVNNSGTVLTTTSPFISVINNFFENDGAKYNLKVAIGKKLFPNQHLNASFNFWGSDDLSVIERLIYDKNDNGSLFAVVVSPYLGSRNFSDVRDIDVTNHTYTTMEETTTKISTTSNMSISEETSSSTSTRTHSPVTQLTSSRKSTTKAKTIPTVTTIAGSISTQYATSTPSVILSNLTNGPETKEEGMAPWIIPTAISVPLFVVIVVAVVCLMLVLRRGRQAESSSYNLTPGVGFSLGSRYETTHL